MSKNLTEFVGLIDARTASLVFNCISPIASYLSFKQVHFSPYSFSPRKSEYILVFPPERSVYTNFFPRKDQYILIFPPDF
jgi:hypothetical protein